MTGGSCRSRRRLTPLEYAEATDTPVQTVRRWIREGKLRVVDLNEVTGKRPRYRIAASEMGRADELRRGGRG